MSLDITQCHERTVPKLSQRRWPGRQGASVRALNIRCEGLLPQRYPERVDIPHRVRNARRPCSVHFDLTAGFALVPAAPCSEKLDRAQEVRPFALQGRPSSCIHTHAFDESHTPFVDYEDPLALFFALI